MVVKLSNREEERERMCSEKITKWGLAEEAYMGSQEGKMHIEILIGLQDD